MYLIAEIGNNHEGDPDEAFRLIDAAIDCGVNAVKMQLFKADSLILKDAPCLVHATSHTSQYERMKSLELPDYVYLRGAELCHQRDTDFMISPFDTALVHQAAVVADSLKVASGEITNHALLKAIADADLPIFMSTGMADYAEITDAIKITGPCTLMHCVSIYPTQPWQANLTRIHVLKDIYPDCPIGYSDHTYGDTACIAAAAMGAEVIEKHFTLKEFGREGYDVGDHQHSLGPREMEDLVIKLRKLDNMLRPANGMDKDMRRFLRRGESGLRGDYKCAS